MSADPTSSTAASPARPTAPAFKPVGVIDIGATSIRMAVAEIGEGGAVRTLETLSQAVSLGKDTFIKSSIGKATIEQCVRVLKSYRARLQEFQITHPSQIRVVATSAVREAENRLAFLDRIYIATGLEVEPLEEAEVSRVTYLGIRPLLEGRAPQAEARSLVVEVGGGSTELLLVRGDNVLFSHTYRLGSMRLRETLEAYRAPTFKLRHIMESQIARTVEQIRQDVSSDGPVELIALGGDVRFAASQLLPDWDHVSLARLELADLARLTDRLLNLTDDQIARRYHLSFADAETVGPALLTYVQLARAFELPYLLVTHVTLRDGLLKEMAVEEAWTEEFSNQIMLSALDLGGKFEFHEAHARHVAELTRALFRQLRGEHQLDGRYELLLYIAALLHEIGMFVSHRSYHKHSMYLIRNSELFGLGRRDALLVSLVARYHRRSSPLPTHEGYATLDRDQRVAVAKMAALLRVAVALDESRSQRVAEVKCSTEDGRIVVSVPGVEDLSLEQLALDQSGTLFEETFGMPVLLRTVRS